MANTQKRAAPVAVQGGRQHEADYVLEVCSGLMGRLSAIESALAKCVRALEGQPSPATSPAAFQAAPRIAPRAPEPQDVPEVAAYARFGADALRDAREASVQFDALSVGPRTRSMLAKQGGRRGFLRNHPTLATFSARIDAEPAPAPVDAPRLVGAPERHGLRPNRGSREKSPTSGPRAA